MSKPNVLSEQNGIDEKQNIEEKVIKAIAADLGLSLCAGKKYIYTYVLQYVQHTSAHC